ncbi:MAG TPA: prephenate dehydrogenase [Terriglobales bacterium]
MKIDQITIVGCGLIGGSLALALKKHRFAGRIVGCDRPRVLQRALKLQAIDQAHVQPEKACRGSAVVVLATPVSTIVEMIRRLAPVLPAGTLLTDTGSTKAEIVAAARREFGNSMQPFLAGHPMAGKEKSGIEFADADLFKSTPWLLTPLPGQDLRKGATGTFIKWLKKIGAHVVVIDAETHDELCAWTSHAPQMISTALAAALAEESETRKPRLAMSGRALKDMTRIANSPYEMWRDVAATNQKNIANALLKVERHLSHIRRNLNTPELAIEFKRAHRLKL